MIDPIEQAESLKNLLTACACGSSFDPEEYVRLRQLIIKHPKLQHLAPRFVRTCRNTGEFWEFIKHKFQHYHERRTYIWAEFDPLLNYLEQTRDSPATPGISDILQAFDQDSVHQTWQRALDRRADDPDGAITLARTLLESVCKHILDELNCAYDDRADLPALYRLVRDQLRLAPSQHQEEDIRQILQGCTTVVTGLGAMRNRMSDAHGAGRRRRRPAPRHAELAVNLAGTMATFLIATFEARSSSPP